MMTYRRMLILVGWIGMLLMGVVTAQTPSPTFSEPPIPPDLQGFYTLHAESGVLQSTGYNERYTLTLYQVPPLIEWLISTPTLYAGRYETLAFLELSSAFNCV